ncbi:hypothetical protein BCR44DRAFT_1426275 [Catenaria anguillulae PL171]|uniref:RNA polymerase II degradation factor 1 n=1 Tax=Catenaria anguillulae PL171 TaxID=765915 RepID=A0A1Y2I2D5_9FUNG|nr:hypothetical protein BCR44DRAFT_1426275 [Catenaria anguillulae PL171]
MSSSFSTRSSSNATSNGAGAGSGKAKSPLADLHSKYRARVEQLAAIFPDWTADDLVLTLDEAFGDVELASMRILEGSFLSSVDFRSCRRGISVTHAHATPSP